MQLVQNIKAAFASRPYPSNDNLLLPGDDEGEGQIFVGSNWWELDEVQLELRTFILQCFTPLAFCYFLPAYLIASIKKPDSGLADSLLDRISPPKNDTTRRSFSEWWKLLSSDQKQVIFEVVRFHAAHGATLRPGVVSALERACET